MGLGRMNAKKTGLWSDVFEQECLKEYELCYTANPCFDNYAGVLDLSRKRMEPIPDELNPFLELPLFVIVLESPHIDEFDDCRVAVGPAQGSTGASIQNNIVNLLVAAGVPRKKYRLLLMEAIPYQCSNNNSPIKKVRDRRNRLFKRIWKLFGGRNYFEERIASYKPAVILNACTGGLTSINKGHSLNGLVQKSLKKYRTNNSKALLYFSNHPSIPGQFLKGIKKY